MILKILRYAGGENLLHGIAILSAGELKCTMLLCGQDDAKPCSVFHAYTLAQ